VGIEDDVIEQRRRMFALLKTPDLEGIRIREDTLFESGGAFFTLKCDAATLVERHEDSGKITPSDTFRWLVKEVERLKIDLLIIDPLVEITEGINENDNAHMQKVMAVLRVLAREKNLHLNVVHHFNKPGEANNPGAVRGGSSIINAARLCINLEKANDKDCDAFGIDDVDRHNRIKMVIPKANNSATGAVHWFAIEPKGSSGNNRFARLV
jgi:RecA-family ATPase